MTIIGWLMTGIVVGVVIGALMKLFGKKKEQ